ncbi:MAG: hypothetical protein HQK54_10380 [Oligoflexales bacterium]|nr:hypothetical protein [Oligoflexales bacterium]
MRIFKNEFLSVETSVFSSLDDMKSALGHESTKNYCISHINEVMNSTSNLLECFFHILWLVEDPEISDSLSQKELSEWIKFGELSLFKIGIRPQISRSSHLYGRLFRAKSRYLSKRGLLWSSMWNDCMAESACGTFEPSENDSYNFERQHYLANFCYTYGYIVESLEIFLKMEAFSKEEEEIVKIKIGVMRCLRILGRYESALSMCHCLEERTDISERQLQTVEWEKSFINAALEGDNAPLISSIRNRKTSSDPYYLSLAALWIYASRSKEEIERIPGSGHVRSLLKKNDPADPMTQEILTYHEMMEGLYNSDRQILLKLKSIGEFLEKNNQKRASEGYILLLCALTRFLYRSKQHKFAIFVMNEYQVKSLSISQGETAKLHNLLDDVQDKLSFIGETSRITSQKKDLATGIRRTLTLAEFMAKLTMALLRKKKNEWINGKDSVLTYDGFLSYVAEILADYAGGQLRGPMQKIGQFFFQLKGLPEEVYEKYKSMIWTGKVMDRKAFINTFEKETGRKVEEVFSFLSKDPIGVGSVSQVYKGRLLKGDEVAVKITYPEMDRIVKHDMKMVCRFMNLFRRFFPNAFSEDLYDALERIFQDECDLTKEAELYEKIRSHFSCSQDIVIPKVYRELSSSKVMVTEYVDGQKFYEIMEQDDQAKKDLVIRQMYRFDHDLRFNFGIIQLDPHPANFLFKGGRLICIDFGFKYQTSPDDMADLRRINEAITSGDPEFLFNTMVDLDYLKCEREQYSFEMKRYMDALIDCTFLRSAAVKDPVGGFFKIFFGTGFNKLLNANSLSATFYLLSRITLNATLARLAENRESQMQDIYHIINLLQKKCYSAG